MSEMDEIIREFLVESNEGLDRMDRDLVELERTPDSHELLGSIFRAIHTVKGTSGVLGFPRLESVAHVGENLLSLMRDNKLRLTPQITSALLAMCDVLRALLTDIESTGQERERDFSEVTARISALAKAGNEVPIVAVTNQEAETVVAECIGASDTEDDPVQTEASDANPSVKQPDNRATATAASNIRVDVGLLDKVMNLVGELVLARNQVLQFTASQNDASFLSTAQRLNLITTELQEGVMKTRMQPIGNVWNKFPRLVRDLAVACGKQVRSELEGSDTELDKTIIEAIKDPLTHVVRNAIDHGIESPELRTAAGKPAEGRLLLRAFHEGGHVNIEIADDGAGIDLIRVKQKALSRGLVPADQLERMSQRELVDLIYLPGFSTTEKVTNVSGRGVGMDVVKTNIEKIGGTVDVSSVTGQGTTLKIKIPLTLAIIPALMVTSVGERFAIPQISLVELVRLEGDDCAKSIEEIQGAPVYRLRGNLLPLVFLDRELQTSCVSEVTRASGGDEQQLDFELAKSKHLDWKVKLKDLLRFKLSMTEEEAGSHQECALGKWLNGHALDRYGSIPAVHELRETHVRFHQAVRDIVTAHNSGQVRTAEENMRAMEALSHEITAQLAKVEQATTRSRAVNIVVLQADGRQFGLVVDEINDTEEIVVKPLGRHLKGVTAFAGATIMGDGRVALILDLMGIALSADVLSHKRDSARAQAGPSTAAAQANDKQQWLLFTAGAQDRMAVPLSTVARLEEIKPESVERAGEQNVVQYRGEIMPLVDVAEVLRMSPAPRRDTMQVIVYMQHGRSVGFVVDDILDVVEQSVAIENESNRTGVKGSAVIQQKVTNLIDLQQIVVAAGLNPSTRLSGMGA